MVLSEPTSTRLPKCCSGLAHLVSGRYGTVDDIMCLNVREKPSSYHYLRTRLRPEADLDPNFTRLLISGHLSTFFGARDVNSDIASEPFRK
jgi:hypothetical protein